MKLGLYQKNIMLKIIKNSKIDDEIKILFLVELLHYNSISVKTAENIVKKYIKDISEESKENLIELLDIISEKNMSIGEIKSILVQNVLTKKIESIESNADTVYMMYNKKGNTFLSILISMFLVVVTVYILTVFAPHTIHNNAYLRDKTKSLYLVQETMEQIQAEPYYLIVSEPSTEISGFTGFYRKIDVTNITDTNKIITVTVTFPEGKTSLSTEKYLSIYEK